MNSFLGALLGGEFFRPSTVGWANTCVKTVGLPCALQKMIRARYQCPAGVPTMAAKPQVHRRQLTIGSEPRVIIRNQYIRP